MHYPEGSVYEDNARLRVNAQAAAPLAWGLRSGWTLVTWVRQLVSAMHYLHNLKPWPVRATPPSARPRPLHTHAREQCMGRAC